VRNPRLYFVTGWAEAFRHGRCGREAERSDGGSGFDGAVQAQEQGVSLSEPQVVCRIRHPHDWVLECMQMPEASWVAALVAEDEDAAPVR